MNRATNVLKNKGFDASDSGDDTLVSLNRRVSFLEVDIALDFEVEREHMIRHNDSIIVLNQL